MTSNSLNLGRFLNRVTRSAAGQIVSDPRQPERPRSFLTPRTPGPLPTPEEVDFAFHLLPESGIPIGRRTPQSLYIADVLKKIRQKYAPGEARRQLRRDYESKLGRRAYTTEQDAFDIANALDNLDEYDPDTYFELSQLTSSKENLEIYRSEMQKHRAALKAKEKIAAGKMWKSMRDKELEGWVKSNPDAQQELMRRKAVRGMQLISRDDIQRRGLLKMAASQLPVVKQGQQALNLAEKASPTLIKALKALLSRKFRSM